MWCDFFWSVYPVCSLNISALNKREKKHSDTQVLGASTTMPSSHPGTGSVDYWVTGSRRDVSVEEFYTVGPELGRQVGLNLLHRFIHHDFPDLAVLILISIQIG